MARVVVYQNVYFTKQAMHSIPTMLAGVIHARHRMTYAGLIK